MYLSFIPEVRELKIPCPVCLTVRERDRSGKARHYNEQWHCREEYPLCLICGADHSANADAPEEVNRLLKPFLPELPTEKM